MEFFDKLGKKASEAYRVTADKTGKIAKETKLKIKMGDLKTKINDIYEEIGKIVYEKHIKKEQIDIEKDLIEQCTNIDVMSDEIESLLKECLELKDRKQCSKCLTEIEKDAKFCPHCGMKQEENKVENKEEILEEQEEKHQESEANSDKKETKQQSEKSEGNETSLTKVEEEKCLISIENNKKEEIKKNEEDNNVKLDGKETNLEKTTIIEINPTPENITEEEVKNIGADEKA